MVMPINIGDNKSSYKGTAAGAILGAMAAATGQLYTDKKNMAGFISDKSGQVSNTFVRAVNHQQNVAAKKHGDGIIKVLKKCIKNRRLPADEKELEILKSNEVFGSDIPDNIVKGAKNKIKEIQTIVDSICRKNNSVAKAVIEEKFSISAITKKRDTFQHIYNSALEHTDLECEKLVSRALRKTKIRNTLVAGITGAIIAGTLGKLFIDNKLNKKNSKNTYIA